MYRCHLGKIIRYDTVSKLHWSVDIRTHGIAVIVEKLLGEDWEEGEEPGDDSKKKGGVPALIEEEDCTVRLYASCARVPLRLLIHS